MPDSTDGPVLVVDEVTRVFRRDSTSVRAVDGVSFAVDPGETLGVIGESGSGKSTLGRLILGLQPCDSGRVSFQGRDLTDRSRTEMQDMRASLTVVFQEPLGSLNPRMTVGSIIAEPLRVHRRSQSKTERRRQVRQALELVALPSSLLDRYPGQLSGGQQQRVNVARAIVTDPAFVVLDEPTSALDLSVQAQILDLLQRLQRELELSYLFISHDVDCIAYMSQRVAVMFRGRLVELGPAGEVMTAPRHPYTRSLLAAALSLDASPEWIDAGATEPIPDADGELYEVAEGHWVAGVARSDGSVRT